jgi:hypothetical protein
MNCIKWYSWSKKNYINYNKKWISSNSCQLMDSIATFKTEIDIIQYRSTMQIQLMCLFWHQLKLLHKVHSGMYRNNIRFLYLRGCPDGQPLFLCHINIKLIMYSLSKLNDYSNNINKTLNSFKKIWIKYNF